MPPTYTVWLPERLRLGQCSDNNVRFTSAGRRVQHNAYVGAGCYRSTDQQALTFGFGPPMVGDAGANRIPSYKP